MSDIWSTFDDAIKSYSSNDYIRDLLESICEDGIDTEINFSLFDTLIPGKSTLINMLQNLVTSPGVTDTENPRTIDAQQIMPLICVCFHMPDDENCEESSTLRSSSIFFGFMNKYLTELLTTEARCTFTYRLLLRKVQERQEKQHEFPAMFFYKYNNFIEMQSMDFPEVKSTVCFLTDYAVSYRNMIQNLSIFNSTCKAGFLSFVCLSSLILREAPEKKKFYVYLFNIICTKLSSSAGMTEMQAGIMNSNFQLLIRQVVNQLQSEADDIVKALLLVGSHYSNLKPLALLINQLPFPLYATLVKVLQNVNKDSYKKERQQFAFSLLESPYIICDSDQEEHFVLTKLLVITVISSIKINDTDAVKRTVQFYDKVLKLQDLTTKAAVKDVTTTTKWYSISNVLNYAFEKTSSLWNKTTVEMNECYISIYCNLFILNYEIPWNNYLQLEEIINSSDAVTLIPSIPILLKLLTKSLGVDDDLTYLIGINLVTNALSPNMQYSRYLQALYNFMFEDGSNGKIGVRVCNIFATFGVKVETLISKMYIQQYFKISTLYKLFAHVREPHALDLLQKAIYIIDSPLALPGVSFQSFCTEFITSPKACMDDNLNKICSIVNKLVQSSYDKKGNDWTFLTQFLAYLENNLLCRMFPIGLLKSAVIVTQKLKEKFRSCYTKLLKLFKDIEARLVDIGDTNSENIYPQFFARDLMYYTEFTIVFGEKAGFVISKDAVDVFNKWLSMPLNDLLNETERTDSIIKATCVLSARREDLILPCSKLLNTLIYVENEQLQILALNGLHDLAVLKSQHFDSLIVPICHFMKSTNPNLQIEGLQVFMTLVDKEYIIPNHWQLYNLTYIIARDYDLIEVKIGKLVIFNFIHTLAKCYEQYFINIVLYFNNYYDHQIYPLKNKDVSRIPTKQVPLDRREAVYKLILRSFSNYTFHKILNHIYNVLFRNMFLSSLTYAKSYELVQDVMTITLIVLQQSNFTYEKSNLVLYNHTIERIKNLDDTNLNRSKIPETDNDNTIRNVVMCLTDLMKLADGRIKFIIPELMHVLLAVCEWYFDNICNIILNEKNKSFYNSVKSLPTLFKSFRHLIHSPVFDAPAPDAAEQPQFYRI